MFGLISFFAVDQKERARIVAKTVRINVAIFLALVEQESGFNVDAEGSAGEIGLCQLKPIAVRHVNQYWRRFFTIKQITATPYLNLVCGALFLKLQLDEFNGDYFDALRAYNQGASGARSGKGHDYALSVMARKDKYK